MFFDFGAVFADFLKQPEFFFNSEEIFRNLTRLFLVADPVFFGFWNFCRKFPTFWSVSDVHRQTVFDSNLAADVGNLLKIEEHPNTENDVII